jgi:hypothetical protein
MAIRLLWRAFGKLILRWLGKKAMEKVQKKFTGQAGYDSQNYSSGRTTEGETEVHSKAKVKRNPKSKKVVGEYVDFEEID